MSDRLTPEPLAIALSVGASIPASTKGLAGNDCTEFLRGFFAVALARFLMLMHAL